MRAALFPRDGTPNTVMAEKKRALRATQKLATLEHRDFLAARGFSFFLISFLISPAQPNASCMKVRLHY